MTTVAKRGPGGARLCSTDSPLIAFRGTQSVDAVPRLEAMQTYPPILHTVGSQGYTCLVEGRVRPLTRRTSPGLAGDSPTEPHRRAGERNHVAQF